MGESSISGSFPSVGGVGSRLVARFLDSPTVTSVREYCPNVTGAQRESGFTAAFDSAVSSAFLRPRPSAGVLAALFFDPGGRPGPRLCSASTATCTARTTSAWSSSSGCS